jgi:hypothetical protein
MQPARKVADDIPKILPAISNFISYPGSVSVNEPLLYKASPIDFTDPLLELLPEVYIDSKPLDASEIERAEDQLTREMASFMIRFGKENLADKLDAED